VSVLANRRGYPERNAVPAGALSPVKRERTMSARLRNGIAALIVALGIATMLATGAGVVLMYRVAHTSGVVVAQALAPTDRFGG